MYVLLINHLGMLFYDVIYLKTKHSWNLSRRKFNVYFFKI